MITFSSSATRRGGLAAATALCLLLAHGPAQAGKTKINYVPGVTLVPDVLLADGQTERTYDTPQGRPSGRRACRCSRGTRSS